MSYSLFNNGGHQFNRPESQTRTAFMPDPTPPQMAGADLQSAKLSGSQPVTEQDSNDREATTMSDASHSDSRSAQRREEGSRNANLVCEIQHGCSDAESRLVQQYQRGLLFIANQYTDDPELAKDIVQETFVVVLQRLRRSGIREPEKLTPFIQKTVRNIMIGHLRKSGRRQTVADTDMIERMASCQVNQETDISRWQEALLVRKLLEELPMQRDREILSRFYLEEEEKDEICRTLKLSDLHFNRVLYRARKRFGALIEVYESQQQALLGKAH